MEHFWNTKIPLNVDEIVNLNIKKNQIFVYDVLEV